MFYPYLYKTKKKMATNDELKHIAEQLAHPSGTKGLEIATMMMETNANMISHALDALNIQPGEHLLEIGHGNAYHVADLLAKHLGVFYTGLETSLLMMQQAQILNKDISTDRVNFLHYDGENFPNALGSFDHILTVNCIYFWKRPVFFITAIAKLLKPNGGLAITFATKDFMRQLPFTKHGFRLYDVEDVLALADIPQLKHTHTLRAVERIKSKNGQLVDREFVTVLWTKTV